MDITSIVLWGVCIILVVYVMVCVIYLAYSIDTIRMYKDLYTAVGNAVETYCETDSYEQFTFELENAINNIVKKNKELKERYNNVFDILNDYVTRINTGKSKIKHQDVNKVKSSINKYIDARKKEYPLEEIDNLNSVVLNKLLESVKSSNEKESIEYIRVLAKEFRDNKEIIRGNEKKEKKQNIISIVGIVLSCFFGIISLIQFVLNLNLVK